MARQWELAEEYNETLLGDPVHDPFIPGTGYALPDNYESVLNVNKDGVMGYIEDPEDQSRSSDIIMAQVKKFWKKARDM